MFLLVVNVLANGKMIFLPMVNVFTNDIPNEYNKPSRDMSSPDLLCWWLDDSSA